MIEVLEQKSEQVEQLMIPWIINEDLNEAQITYKNFVREIIPEIKDSEQVVNDRLVPKINNAKNITNENVRINEKSFFDCSFMYPLTEKEAEKIYDNINKSNINKNNRDIYVDGNLLSLDDKNGFIFSLIWETNIQYSQFLYLKIMTCFTWMQELVSLSED